MYPLKLNKTYQRTIFAIMVIMVSLSTISAQNCVDTPDGISVEMTNLPNGNCNLEVDLGINVPNSPRPKRLEFKIDYDSNGDGSIDAQAVFNYIPGGSIPSGIYNLSSLSPSQAFLISDIDCNTVFTTTITGFTNGSGGSGGDCTTTLGYVDQNGYTTTLPVTVSSFDAKINGAENLIYWTTEGEENNYAQIVQRSKSPTQEFVEIGRIISEGNTTDIRNYSIRDKNPLELGYYRLASLDYDGSIAYSKVAVVERESDEFVITNIYPVPVQSFAAINFKADKTGPLKINVINAVGAILKTINYNAVKGSNSMMLELDELVTGVYVLSIDDGKRQIQKKLMKN